MTNNKIHRFWPIVAPEPRSVEEAATELLDSSTHALRTMAAGRSFVGLALTAGLDSRATLAMAYKAGVTFRSYTYGSGPATLVERTIASQLADQFNFEHTVLPHWVKDATLKQRVNESHYSLHHAVWIGALREYYDDVNAVCLLGNNLEIGRGNYMASRRQGYEAPDTAMKMAVLHHSLFGKKIHEQVDAYGEDRFWSDAEALFQEYIDVTGLQFGLLNPFDQFYWEHRIATWQGVAMGERDFYSEPFIPYNSRRVFETMLGVPDDDRYTDKAVYRMIEMANPDLLEVPINPTRSEVLEASK